MKFEDLQIGKVYDVTGNLNFSSSEGDGYILVAIAGKTYVFLNKFGHHARFATKEHWTNAQINFELAVDQSHSVELTSSSEKVEMVHLDANGSLLAFVNESSGVGDKVMGLVTGGPVSKIPNCETVDKMTNTSSNSAPRPGTFMLKDGTGWVTTDGKGGLLDSYNLDRVCGFIDFSRPCLPLRVGQKVLVNSPTIGELVVTITGLRMQDMFAVRMSTGISGSVNWKIWDSEYFLEIVEDVPSKPAPTNEPVNLGLKVGQIVRSRNGMLGTVIEIPDYESAVYPHIIKYDDGYTESVTSTGSVLTTVRSKNDVVEIVYAANYLKNVTSPGVPLSRGDVVEFDVLPPQGVAGEVLLHLDAESKRVKGVNMGVTSSEVFSSKKKVASKFWTTGGGEWLVISEQESVSKWEPDQAKEDAFAITKRMIEGG